MANTKKKTNTGNKKGTKKAVETKKNNAAKTSTASAKKTSTVKTTTTKNGTRSKTSAAKTKSTGAKKSTSTAKKTTPKKVVAPKEEKIELLKDLENEVKEEKVITTNSDDEKRNKIFTIAAIAVLLIAIILSCIASNKNGKYNKSTTGNSGTINTGSQTGGVSAESEAIKDEERKELNNIGIDDYLSLLEGEEASIIYLARPTCSHCQVQKPIMENLAFKYENLKINYLNTDELDSEALSKLQSSDDFFKEGWGTPTTLIVKGGKIVDSIAGEASGASLVELFKKYGIINE